MKPEVLTTEIRRILDMMGVHVKDVQYQYDTDIAMHIFSIRMSGTDTPLFTENNNEGLRALSYIVKKIAEEQHHVYKNMIFDLNGEDLALIEYTKNKAELAMERVEYFDKPYEFGYLNAYERMIIHSYIKRHKHLETVSEGDGEERRLTIKKRAS